MAKTRLAPKHFVLESPVPAGLRTRLFRGLQPSPRSLEARMVYDELTLGEAREILGLNSQASAEDARRAYRQLALRHHPDKSVEPDAKAKFQRINDAWMRLQAWHEDQEEEEETESFAWTDRDDPQLQAQLERQRQACDRAERDALDQLDSSIRRQQREFSGGWFSDPRGWGGTQPDWAEFERVNRASIWEHFETQRRVSQLAAVSTWRINRCLCQVATSTPTTAHP